MKVPNDIIITDYHVVIQFTDGIHKVFSTIVEDYIYSFKIEHPKSMLYEWYNNTIWIATDPVKLSKI